MRTFSNSADDVNPSNAVNTGECTPVCDYLVHTYPFLDMSCFTLAQLLMLFIWCITLKVAQPTESTERPAVLHLPPHHISCGNAQHSHDASVGHVRPLGTLLVCC
jgi:hypothetical protein